MERKSMSYEKIELKQDEEIVDDDDKAKRPWHKW